MELDINKIIELYKQRLSDLEHEVILLMVQCKMLQEENEEMKNKINELEELKK